MLTLDEIKIRMDAKVEAESEFNSQSVNDNRYVIQIQTIFLPENIKILALNDKTENMTKLLNYFFDYFKNHLKINSNSKLNLNKPKKNDYETLISYLDADIIKWFINDYVNHNINKRIEIIDVINDTVHDIVSLKELLIIQFNEDKLHGIND